MPDFTEGKWEILKLEKYPYYYVGKKDSPNFLATVNTEANARLIAAAPEMYKFIQTLYELITNPEEDEEGLSFRFVPEAAKQILDRINGKGSER